MPIAALCKQNGEGMRGKEKVAREREIKTKLVIAPRSEQKDSLAQLGTLFQRPDPTRAEQTRLSSSTDYKIER